MDCVQLRATVSCRRRSQLKSARQRSRPGAPSGHQTFEMAPDLRDGSLSTPDLVPSLKKILSWAILLFRGTQFHHLSSGSNDRKHALGTGTRTHFCCPTSSTEPGREDTRYLWNERSGCPGDFTVPSGYNCGLPVLPQTKDKEKGRESLSVAETKTQNTTRKKIETSICLIAVFKAYFFTSL